MKKQNAFYKILTALVAIVMLFTPSILLAQSYGDPDEPCSGNSPLDNQCPLDTWVMLLAIVVFVFAILHLSRKQKRTTFAK